MTVSSQLRITVASAEKLETLEAVATTTDRALTPTAGIAVGADVARGALTRRADGS